MLQVHVKRSVEGRDVAHSGENGNNSHMVKTLKPPIVRKAKLVVVDRSTSKNAN